MKFNELNSVQKREAKIQWLDQLATEGCLDEVLGDGRNCITYGDVANVDEIVSDRDAELHYDGREFSPDDFSGDANGAVEGAEDDGKMFALVVSHPYCSTEKPDVTLYRRLEDAVRCMNYMILNEYRMENLYSARPRHVVGFSEQRRSDVRIDIEECVPMDRNCNSRPKAKIRPVDVPTTMNATVEMPKAQFDLYNEMMQRRIDFKADPVRRHSHIPIGTTKFADGLRARVDVYVDSEEMYAEMTLLAEDGETELDVTMKRNSLACPLGVRVEGDRKKGARATEYFVRVVPV